MSTNPKIYPNQDASQPVKTAGLVRRIFAMVKRVLNKDKSEPELSKSVAVPFENMPEGTWSFGCSASNEGMIAAYLDRQFPNLSPDTTPPDGSDMPEYTDAHETNPAITSLETFIDYWDDHGSSLPDPFTRPGEGSTAP